MWGILCLPLSGRSLGGDRVGCVLRDISDESHGNQPLTYNQYYMNNEPTYREKGRAVFLAAIMVLSVVAMSAAFTGAVAAQNDGEVDYVPDNPWQGQDVIASGGAIDSGTEYQLRQVDDIDDNRVSQSTFVEELTADGGEVEIETDDLDSGEYFLRGGDLPRNAHEDDLFDVRIQNLDVTADDDNVTDSGPDSTTELEIDSNRGTYYMNASADGDLDYDELFSIFVDDDAVVQIDNLNDGAILDGALESDDISGGETTLGDIIDATDDISDRADFAELLFESNAAAMDGDDPAPAEGPLLTGAVIDAIEEDGAGIATEGFHYFGDYNTGIYLDGEDDDDSDADEKVALLTAGDVDDDEEIDFDGIDDGTYDFDFNVTDTEASDSVTISVAESDGSANFDQDVYTQTAGDLQHFQIELEDTDEAYLQFGDEDAGFIDILYLEDDDGSGYVNFTVNTRLVGTDHSATGLGLDADDVFYSEDDIVESLIHHGFVASGGDFDEVTNLGDLEGFDRDAHFFDDSDVEGDDAYGDGDGDIDVQFQEYLEELDLISSEDDSPLTQLVRPLQATDYDLTVDENGLFIADGDSDVDDEIGFATLELINPDLGDINTWVGPSEDADEYDDISELVEQLTERDTVAIEDMLVIQAEASGIYGHMAALDGALNNNDLTDGLDDGFEASVLDALDNQDGEGFSISVEDEDPIGNQDENALDFANADDDEIFVLVDNDNGELFIVVDTDASDAFSERDPSDGDEFTVEIEYEVEDERARFTDEDEFGPLVSGGGDGDDEAFPYLRSGDTMSATASFTFEDAAVHWDNVDDDGNVEIEVDDESIVSGETNIAPGSDATQRIRHAGNTSSFLANGDAEIDSDGTFESTFDFSDRDVDDEARITFRMSGSTIDTADGIFVEGVAVEDDDDEDDDVEMDDDADDDVEMDDDVEEPTDDDDEQPGFGVAVALVALLAAAMLALRRRD